MREWSLTVQITGWAIVREKLTPLDFLSQSRSQSRSMKRERELPSAGGLAAVDVEDMAGDE